MNRVTETADAKGAVQKNTYDGADRILTATDRLGNAETYTYDPVKQSMVSAADREGNVTSYESDVNGRITKITYADGARRLIIMIICPGSRRRSMRWEP